MAFRKQAEDRPQIMQVTPPAAIPGGEFTIRGKSLAGKSMETADRPKVRIGDALAPIVVGSASYMVVRVPDGAAGSLVVSQGNHESAAFRCDVGVQIADSVHPVASPAADASDNAYTTLSGQRGQKTPVSVYRIDPGGTVRPFLSDVMNATGLAVDREGLLYVSSRYDGVVYQVEPDGAASVYVEGMGVATGLAFDAEENLYVGDRSGTIFKVSKSRQIYVFATLEPSIAAYHLAFGADDHLYVTGPTTSSYDGVQRISPAGEVEVFYRGLGRPQGLAFDADNNLYVAASLGGRRGVVRIDANRQAELFLSGSGIVGLCFTPSRAALVATAGGLFRVNVGVQGLQWKQEVA